MVCVVACLQEDGNSRIKHWEAIRIEFDMAAEVAVDCSCVYKSTHALGPRGGRQTNDVCDRKTDCQGLLSRLESHEQGNMTHGLLTSAGKIM